MPQIAKQTIVVASSPCVPSRHLVANALKPYAVPYSLRSYAQSETMTGKDGTYMIKDEVAIQNVAEITIRTSQARWVEYLLLCSGRFTLLSRPVDPGNEQWAMGNTMPVPWSAEARQEFAVSECARRQLDDIRHPTDKHGGKKKPDGVMTRLVRYVTG